MLLISHKPNSLFVFMRKINQVKLQQSAVFYSYISTAFMLELLLSQSKIDLNFEQQNYLQLTLFTVDFVYS